MTTSLVRHGVDRPLELRFPKQKKWIPSPTGLGLAFTITAYYSISMFIGALVAAANMKMNKKAGEIPSHALGEIGRPPLCRWRASRFPSHRRSPASGQVHPRTGR